jgi:DnaJ like chaperone protein
MAGAKWIGGFLGLLSGHALGAIAGFALGSLVDMLIDGTASSDRSNNFYSTDSGRSQQYRDPQEGERNGFLFSLMVLAAHIIQADGKIMHSEMELVRNFLRQNFGESAVTQGDQILRKLFEYRRRQGDQFWYEQIRQACREMAAVMPVEHRIQLIAFLAEIAKADGQVLPAEIDSIREVCLNLGLAASVVDQMFSLGGTTLDDAYRTFGLTADATDDELKKTYRRLALQYHPDRVATLGEDVREAAKKKFQELNDAKDRIWKARNIR